MCTVTVQCAQWLCIKAWLNQSWRKVGVTPQASLDFLHVNCRQLSKFFFEVYDFPPQKRELLLLNWKENWLNCLNLKYRKSKEACGFTPTFLQECFNQALMHSHCARCTVTVPKDLHMQTGGVWMAAWLEHASRQLQAVEQVYFPVPVECLSHMQSL